MFGSQTADGVICVRGDAIVSVCFLNKAAKSVVGVVARRVFLVRLGRDQAHVVVRVRGRVPKVGEIDKRRNVPPLSPAVGKELKEKCRNDSIIVCHIFTFKCSVVFC